MTMTLQQSVNLAMENAHDNDYNFAEFTYMEIAEDLVTLDGSLEVATPDELEPMVRKYFAEAGLTYYPKHN